VLNGRLPTWGTEYDETTTIAAPLLILLIGSTAAAQTEPHPHQGKNPEVRCQGGRAA